MQFGMMQLIIIFDDDIDNKWANGTWYFGKAQLFVTMASNFQIMAYVIHVVSGVILLLTLYTTLTIHNIRQQVRFIT
jgi:hypothetical protein